MEPLKTILFDGEDASLFRDFHCGESLPAKLAEEWIKGPAALRSLQRGNQIIAYLNATDKVVGFGAIGRTHLLLPQLVGQRTEIAFIAMVAVAEAFQGQPQNVGITERYSGRIVQDLIERSRAFGLPLLGLYCDPANVKAVSLYAKLGFQQLPERVRHGNIVMVRPCT